MGRRHPQLSRSQINLLKLRDSPLEKTDFLFPEALNCKRQVDDGRTVCPHPLFGAGTLSGLDLCRSCAYCYGSCEFISAAGLFYLEETVSLESPAISYNLSASFSAQIPEPGGGQLFWFLFVFIVVVIAVVILCLLRIKR